VTGRKGTEDAQGAPSWYLSGMTAAHPLAVDLDVRPLDLSTLSPEERAEIEQDMADIAAGRLGGTPHEEVVAALAAKRAREA
jgi:hypothetical protein